MYVYEIGRQDKKIDVIIYGQIEYCHWKVILNCICYSDGDHGIGLDLLRKMQTDGVNNQIWIATRTCHSDFQHIGNKVLNMRNQCAVKLQHP